MYIPEGGQRCGVLNTLHTGHLTDLTRLKTVGVLDGVHIASAVGACFCVEAWAAGLHSMPSRMVVNRGQHSKEAAYLLATQERYR